MASSETVDILVRLRNQRQFVQGAQQSGKAIGNVGKQADQAGKTVARSSGRFSLLRRNMDGSRRSAGLLGSGLRNLRSSIGGVAVAFGTLGLAGALGKVIGEWREAQKAGRDTAAVIKSTGGAANISAAGVGRLSQAISGMAGIDDEQIQSAANKLLTFDKIRNTRGKGNDMFSQTMRAATDLSARFDQGLKPSVTQLGKALQDPAKGLSKLSKTGVSFTAQEEKKIKALQESGNLLGAQKVLLGAVNKQVKGAAAAKADPFDKLKVSLDNLAETIGFAVGPSLAKAANWLAKFIGQMQTGTGGGGKFLRIMASIWRVVSGVARVVGAVGRALGSFAQGLGRQWLGVTRALGGALRVIRALFRGDVPGAIRGVRTLFSGLGRTIGGVMRNVGVILRAVFGSALTRTFGRVRDLLAGLVGSIRDLPGKLAAAGKGMWDWLKTAFKDAMNWVIGKWNGIQFKVPGGKIFDKLGIGGETIGLPDMPLLARGGTLLRGSAIFNEAGPELATATPGGVRITPLSDSQRSAGLNLGALAARSDNRPIIVQSILDGRLVGESVARRAADARARI